MTAPHLILRSVLGIGGVIVALSAAGAAYADPDSDPSRGERQLIADAAGLGIDATDGVDIVSLGHRVCDGLAAGSPHVEQTIDVYNRFFDMKPDDAEAFVDYAVKDLCPTVLPPSAGDQATAEQAVREGYLTKERHCRPDLSSTLESITWDPPGFTADTGGSGIIEDANEALGGQFRATWLGNRWDVEFLFC